MWRTSSLPSLPGLPSPEMVVPIRIPYIGQAELFNHILWVFIISYLKLNYLYLIGIFDK